MVGKLSRKNLVLVLLTIFSLQADDDDKVDLPVIIDLSLIPSISKWESSGENTLNKIGKVNPGLGTHLNSMITILDGAVKTVNDLSKTASQHTTSLADISGDLTRVSEQVSSHGAVFPTILADVARHYNLISTNSASIAGLQSVVSTVTTATTRLANDAAAEIVVRNNALSTLTTATTRLANEAAIQNAFCNNAISMLTTSTTVLANSIALANTNIAALGVANAACTNDIRLTSSALSAMNDKVESINSELKQTTMTASSAFSNTTVLKQWVTANKNALAVTNANIDLVIASESETKNKVDALITSTGILAENLSLVRSTIGGLTDTVTTATTKIEEANSALQSVKTTASSAFSNTTVLKQWVTANKNAINQVAGDLTTVQDTLASNDIALRGLSGSIASLRQTTASNGEQIDFINNNLLSMFSLGIAAITDDVFVGVEQAEPLSEPYEIKQLSMVRANIVINKPAFGANKVVWNSMFGMEGDISLNGQIIDINTDVVFLGTGKLKTLGAIIGNNKHIILGNRTTNFPENPVNDLSASCGDITLVLNSNVNLAQTLRITSDTIIDGKSFYLNLDENVKLIISDNVVLTLANLTLTGMSGSLTDIGDLGLKKPVSCSIVFEGANSQLRLENSSIIPHTDIYIDKGIITVSDNNSGIIVGSKKVEFSPHAKLLDMRTAVAGMVSSFAEGVSVALSGDARIQGGMPMVSIDGRGNTIYFDDMVVWPNGSFLNLLDVVVPVRPASRLKIPVNAISFSPDGRYVCYVHSNNAPAHMVNSQTGAGRGTVRIDALLPDPDAEGIRAFKAIRKDFLSEGKRDGAIGCALWRPKLGKFSDGKVIHQIGLFWTGSNESDAVTPSQLSEPMLGQIYAFAENTTSLDASLFSPVQITQDCAGIIPLASTDVKDVTNVRAAAWSKDGQFLAITTAYPHTMRIYRISDIGQILAAPGKPDVYSAMLVSEKPSEFKHLYWVPTLQNRLIATYLDNGQYKIEVFYFNGKNEITSESCIRGFSTVPVVSPNPCQPILAVVDGLVLKIFKFSGSEFQDTGVAVSLVQNNNMVTKINDVSWSCNGTILVVATDKGIKLLEFDPALCTLKPMIQNIPGDLGPVWGIRPTRTARFSPNGTLLLADSVDSVPGIIMYEFNKKKPGVLANATVVVKQNFTIGGDLHITDDVVFNGRGSFSINIAHGAIVTVASGKKLTIRNASFFGGLCGVFNSFTGKNEISNLILGEGASLVLDNTPISTVGDICFISGTLEIPTGDFMIATPSKIEFKDDGSAKLKLCLGCSIRGLFGQKPQIIIPDRAKDYATNSANDTIAKNVVTGVDNVINATDINIIPGQIQNFDGNRNAQQQLQGFATRATALANSTVVGNNGQLVFTGNGSFAKVAHDQIIAISFNGSNSVKNSTGLTFDSGATFFLEENALALFTGIGRFMIGNNSKCIFSSGARFQMGTNDDDCIQVSLADGAMLDLWSDQSKISLAYGTHSISVKSSVMSIGQEGLEINALDGTKVNGSVLKELFLIDTSISGIINIHENAALAPTQVTITGLDLSTKPAIKFEDKPALYIKKANYTGAVSAEQLYYDLCGYSVGGSSDIVLYDGVDGYTYVKSGVHQNNMKRVPLGASVVRTALNSKNGNQTYTVYNPATRSIQNI